MKRSYLNSPDGNHCENYVKQESGDGSARRALTITEVAGIFILMLIGIVVATILAVIECLFARKMAVSAIFMSSIPPLNMETIKISKHGLYLS